MNGNEPDPQGCFMSTQMTSKRLSELLLKNNNLFSLLTHRHLTRIVLIILKKRRKKLLCIPIHAFLGYACIVFSDQGWNTAENILSEKFQII